MEIEMENDSLADKTLKYWNLSSRLHGRPTKRKVKEVTVEEALNTLGDVTDDTGPHRKLVNCTERLQNKIIMGNEKDEKDVQA